MTIRKRIFRANSLIVVLALSILLIIGGSILLLFKERLLNWYGDNAAISQQYSVMEKEISEMNFSDTNWENYAEKAGNHNYRMIVVNEKGKEVFCNAKHNEVEVAEALLKREKEKNHLESYLVEGVTVFVTSRSISGDNYDIYFVSSPSGTSILGIDRGMFETFIVIFFVVGIASIVLILLLCQWMTKRLTDNIMEPVNLLDHAASRVMQGNLDKTIDYQLEDVFKKVCESFDMMQQHLKEEMETIQSYEKARTEMISGISHDLRTPLTSIKGYIKGMMDGIADTEEKRQKYLSVAYRKSCDMETLITKLFYCARLETGNMPFYFEILSVEDYMKEYILAKKEEFRIKDIQLVDNIHLKPEVCCRIDRDQMQRVFDNLIENSIKYGKREEGLQIQISADCREENVVLTFKDNGPGMPLDKVKNVFEQFYRGDEARNSSCEGSGLGLYVCRYIVEQHYGAIKAESKNGFSVEITLPIVKRS